MTILSFFSALITLCITKSIIKIYILYHLFMFIGCVLQFFPQYKVLKESRDFNAQSIKYFFGIIMGIAISLGILVWLIKEFYFS